MKINGVEFDIDFTDADVLERIENGSKEVYNKAEDLKSSKKTPAEGIRQECKILKDFLDYVLGEGSSEKIFGNKDSLQQCLNAYEDIINEKEKQLSDFEIRVSKYSPDRLQR